MFAADQRCLLLISVLWLPVQATISCWRRARALQEVFAADQQLQRRTSAQMAMPASLHRVSYRVCVDPRSPLLC